MPNNASNENVTINTVDGNYDSPWDFHSRQDIGYLFESNLHANEGVYVRVTPYIGLGYFDGIDDGFYNTPSHGLFDLTNGSYPNLYKGASEYGNYLLANPIVLANHSGDTPPWYTHELMIFGKKVHCPLKNVNIGYNFNLQTVLFDIQNNNLVQPVTTLGYAITPAPTAGTPLEEELLALYGKVMYYKLEFGTDAYNFSDEFFVSSLEWDGSGSFINMSITDELGAPLQYHNGTFEIVYDKNLAIGLVPNFRRVDDPMDTTLAGRRYHKTMSYHAWGTTWTPWMPAPHAPFNVHLYVY